MIKVQGVDRVGLAVKDVPLPAGLPIHHPAFPVNRVNFETARGMLRLKGIEFEFQDHAIVHSLYF